MNRIVVYTCIVGGYDVLAPPAFRDAGVDYICFTDDACSRVNGWQMQPIEEDVSAGSSLGLVNRHHKFFPHRMLAGYRWSVYIDGNIRIRGRLSELVRRMDDHGAVLAMSAHPERTTLADELEACIHKGKLSELQAETARQQLAEYTRVGMPSDIRLSENSVLIRQHNDPRLIDAMETWWEELLRWVPRDQLSLPYVVWRTQIPHLLLAENKRSGEYFTRVAHGNHGWRRRLQWVEARDHCQPWKALSWLADRARKITGRTTARW